MHQVKWQMSNKNTSLLNPECVLWMLSMPVALMLSSPNNGMHASFAERVTSIYNAICSVWCDSFPRQHYCIKNNICSRINTTCSSPALQCTTVLGAWGTVHYSSCIMSGSAPQYLVHEWRCTIVFGAWVTVYTVLDSWVAVHYSAWVISGSALHCLVHEWQCTTVFGAWVAVHYSVWFMNRSA